MINYTKPKVYVAGQITADHPLKYIKNLATMENHALEIWKMGYPCYSPCEDILRFMIAFSHGIDINAEDVYQNSLAMLIGCDVLYLPKDSIISPGVQKELDVAEKYRIPIIKDLTSLCHMVKCINGRWKLDAWE